MIASLARDKLTRELRRSVVVSGKRAIRVSIRGLLLSPILSGSERRQDGRRRWSTAGFLLDATSELLSSPPAIANTQRPVPDWTAGSAAIGPCTARGAA